MILFLMTSLPGSGAVFVPSEIKDDSLWSERILIQKHINRNGQFSSNHWLLPPSCQSFRQVRSGSLGCRSFTCPSERSRWSRDQQEPRPDSSTYPLQLRVAPPAGRTRLCSSSWRRRSRTPSSWSLRTSMTSQLRRRQKFGSGDSDRCSPAWSRTERQVEETASLAAPSDKPNNKPLKSR